MLGELLASSPLQIGTVHCYQQYMESCKCEHAADILNVEESDDSVSDFDDSASYDSFPLKSEDAIAVF